MRKLNRNAFRKAVWSSLSRVIGVILAAGAGNILRELIGARLQQLGAAVLCAALAWLLMLYAEYEREL